jgi:[protein-PII] uridylyltransferase
LTIVDIVTEDRPALFEKIAGGFSVSGLNILGARAVTRADGIAIDVFYVEEEKGGIVNNSKTRQLCESSIHSFLENENSAEKLIKEKRKKSDKSRLFSNEERLGEKIPPQVDVYHDVALGRIIVEVRAADQVGLLHLIAKTISKCGFSIQFARVATEQGIATDIFNIERASENKNSSPAQFLELREELSKSLNAEKYYVEV